MAFKAKEFDKAKFEPRTADVPVPGMQEWFDGPPIWKVRGLSGNELGKCNELAERNRKTIVDIAKALIQNSSAETSAAIQDLVGLSDDVPQDVARRIEYLMAGSVDPDCTLERAVLLNTAFPVEFRIVTEKIFELTGLGHTPGKPTPSGNEQTSK
ncbi:MAG: hypothetical protein V1844_09915 [Pseudomonadota bacterium]